MKRLALLLLAAHVVALSARADLTIKQTVETPSGTGEMTIKIKGDKARVDASPHVSTIVNSSTGELLNLMHAQKMFSRIPADRARAMAELALKADPSRQSNERPKLVSTGRKEVIGGHEAEEYRCEAPGFTATYWISRSYPAAASIVEQLRAMSPDAWGVSARGMPDYRDFPGLPLRSSVTFAGGDRAAQHPQGMTITTTLVSVDQSPLDEAEFTAPADFKEMKTPEMEHVLGAKAGAPTATPSPRP